MSDDHSCISDLGLSLLLRCYNFIATEENFRGVIFFVVQLMQWHLN